MLARRRAAREADRRGRVVDRQVCGPRRVARPVDPLAVPRPGGALRRPGGPARAALASGLAGALALAGLVATSPRAGAAAVPAFPGAAGPATHAGGGRGGDVHDVTNLTDNAAGPQPGSLRHGISTAPSSGRTIVFDVAGTTKPSPAGRQGRLGIGASNLTIAGQTTPRPGVTIMGWATKTTAAGRRAGRSAAGSRCPRWSGKPSTSGSSATVTNESHNGAPASSVDGQSAVPQGDAVFEPRSGGPSAAPRLPLHEPVESTPS
ncbi:hypothetical protein [Actinosynnema pretiosum]|uniref:hypothetical protein n=1 Tax=Actinosynnema pretiosum TaxID=42197 RepID=UPI0012FDDFFB|nr:hypothetical protein [Actinosynnema pretiosum]